MIELEIDGQPVSIEEGASIIEAADSVGIYIPRFCYHKKLSIAANCRMCLVEVENMGKPMPACATPVTAEMKVFTTSKKAVEAQRAVMEFLLINHPLDCPICDQGGQCELQDISMSNGRPYSYYEEGKRAVFDENIGPLVETCMTRCIQCTRCVRFGEEIAGMRELGVVNRGEKEAIGTYVKHMLQSEMSANITDICPVGALIEKPSRYRSRAWEMREHASIAAHDCVGSNIYVHSFFHEYSPDREVLKVVPRENEAINEIWISDRDRFSYIGLSHDDRVMTPRMKKNGQWQNVDWKRALLEVADRLLAIKENQGAEQIASLVSPNATIEEQYLLQKLMRGLGSNNIDHRLRQNEFLAQDVAPAFPNLGMPIASVEDLDTALIVGADLRSEAALIGHRLNKASQEGAQIFAINPVSHRFKFKVSAELLHANIVQPLAEVAKVLADKAGQSVPALNAVQPSETAINIANALSAGEHAGLFVGSHAINHPHFSQITELCRLIADLSGAQYGSITVGANSSGAWLSGAVPHRGPAHQLLDNPGLSARDVLCDNPVRAYVLFNVEPEFDSAYPAAALEALKQAGLVVCMSTHASEAMLDYADFILPIAPFTETAGTYVNVEGTWQSFAAVTVPTQEVKPGWKVLRALANFLELDGFQFKTAHAVRNEIETAVQEMPKFTPAPVNITELTQFKDGLIRFAPWHMYRSDNMVRRAGALQECITKPMQSVRVNEATAKKYQIAQSETVVVKQGEQRITMPLVIDDHVADDVVVLPSGLAQTEGFGRVMDSIQVERGAQ